MKYFFPLLLTAFSFCKAKSANQTVNDKNATLKELYIKYQNGAIDQCIYKEDTVFTAQLNAYDVPTVIYNLEGEKIGECNFAFGKPDPICNELQNCKTIYRVKNNIWGLEEVNKLQFK